MLSQISDQEQRLQALDHSRSFIVQAPAGSGKTELLIQRFLVLLAQVDQPEAVVAITFTRKAAAEMCNRVIAALETASGPEPETRHEKQTWDLAKNALAHNDRHNWRLTEHPSRLRIQTIDSLCAMLVRQMPWLSRMGAAVTPEEDAGPMYHKAARRTLAMLDSEWASAETSEALSRLLAHLDNRIGAVEGLLGTMLGKRDQWLRHVGGKAAPALLREDLEASLSHVVKLALKRLVAAFPEEFRADTVELAQFAAGNLQEKAGESSITSWYGRRDFPDASIESLTRWLGLAEMFLTKSGLPRTRLTKNEGFPATAAGRAAKARLSNLELNPAVIALLHELRTLPPTRFEESQWNILASVAHLLPVAVGQLRLVFQEEGCADFAEIAIGARVALGSDVAPTDLTATTDCRIQHLLVDEFQDTSKSQFDLLTRLIGDWQAGDGRTLFLVGDPMQSIYGFREAEVGLFLRARTNGVGASLPTPLTLSMNFRSSVEIVEWVNRAMGDAFPISEDAFTGAVTYNPSVSLRTDMPDSAVFVHPFLESGLEAEAKRVVDIIDEAHAKRPGESIAVLVRARSHLVGIVSALRSRGKNFRSVEIDALGERPVVRDLMALTQALLHPGNRLAWLSILRAPWCGLTLTDLDALVSGDFTTTVWDLLQDRARREKMCPDGRERIDRLIPILDDALAQRGRLPVRRCVEGVWIALGGPACLETRTELEDASAFLDLLDQSLDGLDVRDENTFAEDVARLFAPSNVEAGEDLQLLTIHKAKGLEFDTVILPGLGRRTRADDLRLLMWREYMDDDRSRLLLAPIREEGGERNLAYEYLRSIESQRHGHESARLLYVAATRARKNLHLLGHSAPHSDKPELKPPDKRSLLANIWNTVEPGFADALMNHPQENGVDHAVLVEPKGVPLRRLSAHWRQPSPPDLIVWKSQKQLSEPDDYDTNQPTFRWVGYLQQRVGNVVHRMLQQMRAPDRLSFSEHTLRTALRYEGVDGTALDKAVSRVTLALDNTVRDDRGRWILTQHDHDEREFEITAVLEGRIRPLVLDRTFVVDGKRWIVDYKTGSHAGGDPEGFLDNEQDRYRAQLERYASAIQSMDSRPIFLGLYFPMLRGWRDWQFEGGTLHLPETDL